MRSNTRELSNEIIAFTHLAFLRVLLLSDAVKISDIVFHGGACLEVMYQSPLHSAGLDFIIHKKSVFAFNSSLPFLVKDVKQLLMLEFPNMNTCILIATL